MVLHTEDDASGSSSHHSEKHSAKSSYLGIIIVQIRRGKRGGTEG
jgi:hypothetical protein